MFPLRRFSAWLCLALFFLAAPAHAQGGGAANDSLKARIAHQRAAVLHADSTGGPAERARQRTALAALLPTPEAVAQLREAARWADSSGSAPLRLQVQELLATRSADAGRYPEAYAGAMAALHAQRALDAAAMDSLRTALAGQLADSARSIGDRLARMAGLNAALTAEAQAQRLRADGRAWGALALGLLLLAAVFLLIRRLRQLNRRTQDSLAALQQQVDELKDFRNRRRETPPAPAPPAPEPAPPALSTVDVDAAMDPVVAALFRKQAPDRLQALRTARANSDQDKVLRVVHSLKPQLAGFDAERFIPLCARITAPSSQLDPARWNADLDRLEDGVESVLRRLAQ